MAVSRKNRSMKKLSKTHKRKTVMKGSGVFGRIAKTLHLTRNKNEERFKKLLHKEYPNWPTQTNNQFGTWKKPDIKSSNKTDNRAQSTNNEDEIINNNETPETRSESKKKIDDMKSLRDIKQKERKKEINEYDDKEKEKEKEENITLNDEEHKEYEKVHAEKERERKDKLISEYKREQVVFNQNKLEKQTKMVNISNAKYEEEMEKRSILKEKMNADKLLKKEENNRKQYELYSKQQKKQTENQDRKKLANNEKRRIANEKKMRDNEKQKNKENNKKIKIFIEQSNSDYKNEKKNYEIIDNIIKNINIEIEKNDKFIENKYKEQVNYRTSTSKVISKQTIMGHYTTDNNGSRPNKAPLGSGY